MSTDVLVLAGSTGGNLAEEIAGLAALPLAQCSLYNYGSECCVRFDENVRGREVFVVQALCDPVNEKLIELALIISALRRASAFRITAVVPYFAYGQQTQKLKSRVPVSASDIATLWEEMGVDQVMSVDVQCGQIAGFFSPRCCLDNLSCLPTMAKYLWQQGLHDPVVVAPHATGVPRAKEFLDVLVGVIRDSVETECDLSSIPILSLDASPASLAMLNAPATSRKLELIGEVAGRDTILVEDIIDGGKSVCRCVAELLGRGAARVVAVASHGVFSAGALDRLAASAVQEIVVTNTLPIVAPKEHPVRRKLTVLSAAPVLAHHICSLADMPPPEGLDPLAPTFALHGPQEDLPDRSH